MERYRIRIGTSGWHYKHWLGTFYPAGTKADAQLQYYLRYFDTVEINNSFYRLPSLETFETWKNAVPDDFMYAVKASRFITHAKKLLDPEQTLHDFMDRVPLLAETLGVILFQLPPHWKVNSVRLQQFLAVLPKGFRYVIEFRNETWYQPEIYDLLREYNVAFCIYELAGHITPMEVTADFVYVRLHGPGNKYQGNYSEADLQQWAVRCGEWAAQCDVFVYFDNDEEGYAAFNAIRLRELTA